MTHSHTYKAAVFLALLGQGSFVLGAAPAAPSNDPAPVTLRQCYEWARERSEELKMRREDVEQIKAQGRAALAGAYPYVDWKWTDTWQDPQGIKKLEAKGFGGFVEKNQVESRFSAKQPLFSGLKEWSAYKGAKQESESLALRLERADKELFQRTAEAFYTVLLHETDRANTNEALTLDQDRLKELRGFRRLGKSRDSEVFTAEAHAAALKADLQRIQSDIDSSREDLSFLTGQDMSALPLADEIPNLPSIGALDDVLAQARERSDLRAQRAHVSAQKMRIRYEKGLYWPVVDVTGNYYTQRATFLDEINWDVVLNLQVPIFQGGAVSAHVREAKSAYQQSLLTLQQAEREVTHAVRKMHGQFTTAVKQVQSLEEASDAAQKSYDALMKEYKLALVTNLEVLQAMDLLRAQKSARDAARLNAKMLYLQLNVATEKFPAAEGTRP